MLKIGASNGYAFFGVGGPYWDSNGTARRRERRPADERAMGLAISDVTFGIALMRPVNAARAARSRQELLRAQADGQRRARRHRRLRRLDPERHRSRSTRARRPVAGGVARAVDFKLIQPDSNLPIRAGPDPEPGRHPRLLRVDLPRLGLGHPQHRRVRPLLRRRRVREGRDRHRPRRRRDDRPHVHDAEDRRLERQPLRRHRWRHREPDRPAALGRRVRDRDARSRPPSATAAPTSRSRPAPPPSRSSVSTA